MRSDEGVYILQNLPPPARCAKSMDQMIGDWAMVRGNGNVVCGLVLTNNDAGNDNFEVFLKPEMRSARSRPSRRNSGGSSAARSC